jgi:putative addiction module component (TIGR02574 family)
MSTSEIVARALSLPTGERAKIAQQLLRSLEPDIGGTDADADAAWGRELIARSDALHAGEVTPTGWREAVERVRRSLPPEESL